MSIYKWIESEVPSGLEIRQIYGFIFDLDGRILLLEDEGRYNLPGGKPDVDESINETLARESMEEAQVTFHTPIYLGYQMITDEENYAQVRLAAFVKDVLPLKPDPSTGRQYARLWVPPDKANDFLNWGESGDLQIKSAVAVVTTEVPISGGRLNRGRLVRVGDVVLRPADEDLAVEQVMTVVGRVFPGIPKLFGRDEAGRLKLEWIEGEVSELFVEDAETSKICLLSVGKLLRVLHDSTSRVVAEIETAYLSFMDPAGRREVICHGDPGPGNVVFKDGVAIALIDWEMAMPGRRSWDLATALRYWAPLRSPQNKKPAELLLDPHQRAKWILDGYSASDDLRKEVVQLLSINQKAQADYVISRIEAQGESVYGEWVSKGGLWRLELDAQWLEKETEIIGNEWFVS